MILIPSHHGSATVSELKASGAHSGQGRDGVNTLYALVEDSKHELFSLKTTVN